MQVEGGTFKDLSLEGIVVSTLFDEDDDPGTLRLRRRPARRSTRLRELSGVPMKVTIIILLIAPSLPAVEFELGFEGLPGRITGQAGEVKVFEVYMTLTTRDNSSPDGAQ